MYRVRKEYNGSIDAAALEFSFYDPLENLREFPMDPSAGIRCAEIYLFFAVDSDVPGDLCSREALMDFLRGLNSKNGISKIHVFLISYPCTLFKIFFAQLQSNNDSGVRLLQAFYVTAGSVVATREKVQELRGNHLTA
ncbi:hypothetical protein KSS87_021265 [Heliosperma pusillum]|nr:hypothetical protein KSS87_021265 [Heliosperma pusillum]